MKDRKPNYQLVKQFCLTVVDTRAPRVSFDTEYISSMCREILGMVEVMELNDSFYDQDITGH